MFDCASDVEAFHDNEVTLPQAERTAMRGRRDANRDRLKKGLKEKSKPAPREFISQGSYAMKTMVQHPDNKYDIDDGVYFAKEALVGDRGAMMSALKVRQMVRDVIDDGSFKTPPEVRNHCVRVYYEAGYHVDLPIYRRVTTTATLLGAESYVYELASTDWKRSDARDVTNWFESENNSKSPDTADGRQLRRIVRKIKKFARSRDSWYSQILSGFGITKLVTECFRGDAGREDKALYETMRVMRDRLKLSLVVHHPVTPNETITKGTDDPRARFLRDRLGDAIDALAPLFDFACTRKQALKCWDKVFATSYFSDRENRVAKAAPNLLKGATVAPAATPFVFPNAPRVDDKPRGFG
jgi:cyclic GMP-AMP synthase DncV-like protein